MLRSGEGASSGECDKDVVESSTGVAEVWRDAERGVIEGLGKGAISESGEDVRWAESGPLAAARTRRFYWVRCGGERRWTSMSRKMGEKEKGGSGKGTITSLQRAWQYKLETGAGTRTSPLKC